MSCQLTVWGRDFAPVDFVERLRYRRGEIAIRGVLQPGKPPDSPRPRVSSLLVWIGPRNFGPLSKQVNAALRFLHAPSNQAMLAALRNEPGIDEAKIEFGIRWEDVIVQNDLLSAKLVEAAGQFGLSIVIAHYPVEED